MTIKHETITVSGTVLYCDGCGQRGPESAYDNIDDTMDQAEQMGWTQTQLDDRDKDLCDACTANQEKLKNSKKRSA